VPTKPPKEDNGNGSLFHVKDTQIKMYLTTDLNIFCVRGIQTISVLKMFKQVLFYFFWKVTPTMNKRFELVHVGYFQIANRV